MFLLQVILLICNLVFAKKPIQKMNENNGLYFSARTSLLGTFQEFLIIRDSIAIFECLTERGGVISNAKANDTLILVNEITFISKRHRIKFIDDYFVLSDQKYSKKVTNFKKANENKIKQWHSKHNRMMLDTFYENSKEKRIYTQYKVDTAINWILLFDDLKKKCLKLDSESFSKEIEIFEEKYFYER